VEEQIFIGPSMVEILLIFDNALSRFPPPIVPTLRADRANHNSLLDRPFTPAFSVELIQNLKPLLFPREILESFAASDFSSTPSPVRGALRSRSELLQAFKNRPLSCTQ